MHRDEVGEGGLVVAPPQHGKALESRAARIGTQFMLRRTSDTSGGRHLTRCSSCRAAEGGVHGAVVRPQPFPLLFGGVRVPACGCEVIGAASEAMADVVRDASIPVLVFASRKRPQDEDVGIGTRAAVSDVVTGLDALSSSY